MPVRSAQESPAALGPVGEREWQRLRRQFELATDPWLGFIFCPARGPVAALRQRTEFTLGYRARQMRRIHPKSPDELRALMPQLFDEVCSGCVWVEAIAVDSPILDDGVGPWAGAWDWLMLRINERRDALRRRLAGPLLFVVHPQWKPRLRDAAPDLWSVRSLVLDLPGNEGRPATDRSDAPEEASKANDDVEYVTSVEQAQAALDQLAEMPSPNENSLARLHMYMASALLAADRASEAIEHSDKALANTTSRNTRLRAQVLAVSARTKLQADQDVATALHHLGEAVGVWRSILNRDGETPQTLRDLSVSLIAIGGIHEAAGDASAAEAAYEEALAIDRRLVETVGEGPQTLRGLSVSLDRLGGVREAAGDASAAEAAYEEALAIGRRLVETVGEGPQTLRDLSVSLERLGRIREAAGDASAAEAAYEEALGIRRRLVETVGGSPQTLRDLSVLLISMGGIREAAGDASAAEAAYEEALAIDRRLVETVGETPQMLHDLSVSLERVDRIRKAASETP